MQRRSPFQQITEIIASILNEVWMNIELSLFNNSSEVRLKWLRHTYYHDPKVSVGHRRVKEVLREHVNSEFYPYYERLLTSERSLFQLTQKLPAGVRGDELLDQMQRIGHKVIQLIEQVQIAAETKNIYPKDSPEAQSIADSRQRLIEQIEQTLSLHASIPARVLSFSSTTAGRGMDKMSERIERLTNRLDDLAESYAEIDQYMPEHERQILEEKIQESIRDLETETKSL